MKLRTKFVVVLFAVTVVLSSVTYGGLELYKQETLERNQESVDESARLAADQIASKVRERRDYIGYVASQPATANFSKAEATVGGVVNNSRFFAAQIVAANGTVVAFGGQINETVRRGTLGANVSDEAYFAEATTRSSYVSAPESVPSRDRTLVVISAPIITDDGLHGVFAASIYVSTDTLLDPVAALDTRTQRVTVTADDTVLLDSDDRFSQVLVGRATVEGTGWELTVARDRSRLNAQLQSLALAQGVGLFLVLLAVVGFWTWEYRMNLRQTERLLDGFSALLDGDHGYSLDMTASEEWMQIGEGFNELSTGLAAREAAVNEREQRLEVLNRILRHNLRNDMNVVLGYADVISSQSERAVVVDAAETIHETGSDLVDLGRKAQWIDEGLDDSAAERRQIDVVPLVDDVVADLSAAYPAVEVRTALASSAPALVAPAVETALRNVVENACEHNDAAEPRVDVAVTVGAGDPSADGADAESGANTDADPVPAPDGGDGGRVRIVVADNGPGISDYEREVVTGDRETALEHGSGIGLWLSRWLVEHSGGTLDFDDNLPRGTVVTLSFARATHDAQ
ncbi:sensor histidine kinase [Salinigranum marinum]|uniref:sensor histidine kinase n=1 Tax=Salinigranum marinum TaxID=1515595 RepID=UPI002989CA10|nr:sensor histidine kinase [Salinigranum marinum]